MKCRFTWLQSTAQQDASVVVADVDNLTKPEFRPEWVEKGKIGNPGAEIYRPDGNSRGMDSDYAKTVTL